MVSTTIDKENLFYALRSGKTFVRFKKQDGTIKEGTFSLLDEHIGDHKELLEQLSNPSAQLRAYSIGDKGYRTINVETVQDAYKV